MVNYMNKNMYPFYKGLRWPGASLVYTLLYKFCKIKHLPKWLNTRSKHQSMWAYDVSTPLPSLLRPIYMHILKFYCHYRLALLMPNPCPFTLPFFLSFCLNEECRQKHKNFFRGKDFRYLDNLNIQCFLQKF